MSITPQHKISVTIQGTVFINGEETKRDGVVQLWVTPGSGAFSYPSTTIDGVEIGRLCTCNLPDCPTGTLKDRMGVLAPVGPREEQDK